MSDLYTCRWQALKKSLAHEHYDGIVVSKRENIHYLTGLSQVHPKNREALLFVGPSQAVLYHSLFLTPRSSPHYISLAMKASPSLNQVISEVYPLASVNAIEGQDLTVNEYEQIRSGSQSNFIATNGLIEQLRVIKYSVEIKAIKKACHITSLVMRSIIDKLKDGLYTGATELEVKTHIERQLIDLGADGLAFPVIVAADAHAASPHHESTTYRLTPHSVILMDFGCHVKGYAADMTRTIKLGSTDFQFIEIESIVKKAYRSALKKLSSVFSVTELTQQPSSSRKKRPVLPSSRLVSITAADIDKAARLIIEEAGFGKYFIHTTGHGLGLEIHESPSLHQANVFPIKRNMTMTIEPGIYLPHRFGYRYENTLLVT